MIKEIRNIVRAVSLSGRNSPLLLDDDFFLVSYPKSGNTWLRFLLANLQYPTCHIDFTNIHTFSHEYSRLENATREQKRPRIIKSHEHFNRNFKNVIYIVRDGRDAYVSYYHYLTNTLPPNTTFTNFLDRDITQYGRWSDHINSWLSNCTKINLLMIKYEDIHKNPRQTLKQITKFIGLHSNDELIRDAIEKCSFSKMKNLENTFGRGTQKTGPETFMRKGQVGDWKSYFGDREKLIFKKHENKTLIKLKYESIENW